MRQLQQSVNDKQQRSTTPSATERRMSPTIKAVLPRLWPVVA
jgi:hypothetical protein